jgi:septum formation protein
MNLILGSSSPYRKKVLEDAGYTYTTMSPDIDEKAIRDSNLLKLPLLIAFAKADALVPQLTGTDGILITADQIVMCNGQLYEKPRDKNEAMTFLVTYATYPAMTVSAVVAVNLKTGRRSGDIDIAQVNFSPIPPKVMKEYIEGGTPFTNAGGFDHEHPLIQPYIKEINGTSDSVKGLPLKLMEDLIRRVQ